MSKGGGEGGGVGEKEEWERKRRKVLETSITSKSPFVNSFSLIVLHKFFGSICWDKNQKRFKRTQREKQ